MADTLGTRLRARREEKGLDLAVIAERTKIKRSLLEALERDDVRQWPAGIFRRAFLRSYAKAIDLDAEAVVREFLERYPEQHVEVVPAVSASANGRVNGGGLRSVVGAAIGSFARVRRLVPLAEEAENAPPPLTVPDTPCLPTPETPAPDKAVADLIAVAQLCTRFSRVDNISGLRELLKEAAAILDATGLIVWVWDRAAAELRPTLALGYSSRAVAQMPPVKADADNATAVAFRSAEPCAMEGREHARGALAVPLMTPAGCAGVLAIELPHGSEPTPSVRAMGVIFGAVLSQLVASG